MVEMDVSLQSIMAGIYLHVPFCKQACHYCDFHFSTNTAIRRELLQQMVGEIMLQRDYLSKEVITTIYFGGGTPSLLDTEEIKMLLDTIQNFFSVQDPEVTLEANPDDLTLSRLIGLKQSGINRLSIGIQSFQDDILKFLNRAHTSSAARQSVIIAREAGFENISIDLMYAIPGQTNENWMDNIKETLSFKPEHISSYSLTIEEKTAFGRWTSQGKLTPPNDDVAAHQLEILVNELEIAGYEQYEVSNFCRPGYQSRHNSNYWKQQKYLGIGPSAHSYNLISRQFNVSNNSIYVRSLQAGKIPFEFESLSAEDHVNEYLLTTLRTSWGCDLEKLKKDFQYDIPETHREFLKNLTDKKLAIIENNFLRLTKAGKLLADKITADLFLVS